MHFLSLAFRKGTGSASKRNGCGTGNAGAKMQTCAVRRNLFTDPNGIIIGRSKRELKLRSDEIHRTFFHNLNNII